MPRILLLLPALLLAGCLPSGSDAAPRETLFVLFSPSPKTEDTIVGFILSAKKSVHVLAYDFTSVPIGKALIKALQRGVDARVVMDKNAANNKYCVARLLSERGIPVRLDAKYSIQHEKVIIVDGVSVETGSYNYTRAARDQNSENVLIIRNSPGLAGNYEANWWKLWSESVNLR